jgi:hypothetical protein
MKYTLLELSTIGANFTILVGFLAGLWQLWNMYKSYKLQLRSLKSDHARRKSQVTIEFYDKINSTFDPLAARIREICKARGISEYAPISMDLISEEDAKTDELEKKLSTAIRRYLSLMERFSVGVHVGVYDIDIFQLMYGTRAGDNYKRLSAYIEDRRQHTTVKNAYRDYQNLVEELNNNTETPENKRERLRKKLLEE